MSIVYFLKMRYTLPLERAFQSPQRIKAKGVELSHVDAKHEKSLLQN